MAQKHSFACHRGSRTSGVQTYIQITPKNEALAFVTKRDKGRNGAPESKRSTAVYGLG
jgi:hypothetical protein